MCVIKNNSRWCLQTSWACVLRPGTSHGFTNSPRAEDSREPVETWVWFWLLNHYTMRSKFIEVRHRTITEFKQPQSKTSIAFMSQPVHVIILRHRLLDLLTLLICFYCLWLQRKMILDNSTFGESSVCGRSLRLTESWRNSQILSAKVLRFEPLFYWLYDWPIRLEDALSIVGSQSIVEDFLVQLKTNLGWKPIRRDWWSLKKN